MLSHDLFRQIVANAPLISIDFISEKDDQILLGKRINPPAEGFWFVPGGRIYKNELIRDAIKRLSSVEFGIPFDQNDVAFQGVYQHLYQDSIFGNSISTHYIVLAYKLSLNWLNNLEELPKTQHSIYRFFTVNGLLCSETVHTYTKNYFREINND
ncbi:MAG: GDP-mannose mannosyl hydrolase [Desulfobacteraceae bacterium]|jgi:colanic acid biosynthesis protein WcaH